MPDFYKYQALGNSYAVIETTRVQHLDAHRIRTLCDPNYGLGTDGILHLSQSPYRLRIYNPDGSEAEKSGNGLRIAAAYIFSYYEPDTPQIQIQLNYETVTAYRDANGRISVDMGVPSEIYGKRLSLNGQVLQSYTVSMGNPHCVVLTESALAPEQVRACGPVIEAMFAPERSNVQFLVKPERGADLTIEIWERGAGYTLASGSSSCAVAAVALHHGWVASPVTVHMPGGSVLITQIESGSLLLQGPVTPICRGYFLGP